QYRRFRQFLDRLLETGLRPPLRHISGSAAALLLKEARLDLVRLGIAIYGLWPADETRLLLLSRGRDLLELVNDQFENGQAPAIEELLSPALSFKTRCLQVKSVPAGCKVGYGCTYETQRPTRIAVLPVGYAEGYDRHLSNCGEVLIRGRRARVLGRICMNLTVVDVTDIPEVAAGDEVVLIGTQNGQSIRAEEVAAKIGTIHYEVVTRIPTCVPRVFV
ncbi:MAG: alanine racemase, partial [Candidatus Eremiobacteraeota bacterium]|nr:alanine racemase [Candidatus Eremiobacteraeota bacterium]